MLTRLSVGLLVAGVAYSSAILNYRITGGTIVIEPTPEWQFLTGPEVHVSGNNFTFSTDRLRRQEAFPTGRGGWRDELPFPTNAGFVAYEQVDVCHQSYLPPDQPPGLTLPSLDPSPICGSGYFLRITTPEYTVVPGKLSYAVPFSAVFDLRYDYMSTAGCNPDENPDCPYRDQLSVYLRGTGIAKVEFQEFEDGYLHAARTTYTFADIPEPGTGTLMLCTLGAGIALVRRRRASTVGF